MDTVKLHEDRVFTAKICRFLKSMLDNGKIEQLTEFHTTFELDLQKFLPNYDASRLPDHTLHPHFVRQFLQVVCNHYRYKRLEIFFKKDGRHLESCKFGGKPVKWSDIQIYIHKI